MTEAFPMVEMAVKEIIEAAYEPARGHTGGDLSYDGEPLYVWIALFPGSGQTDQVNGEWTVEIDTFAPTYGEAMRASLDLEALLVGRRHTSDTMRLDHCTQNQAPSERPWDVDESTSRVGAVYTFTARRSG